MNIYVRLLHVCLETGLCSLPVSTLFHLLELREKSFSFSGGFHLLGNLRLFLLFGSRRVFVCYVCVKQMNAQKEPIKLKSC